MEIEPGKMLKTLILRYRYLCNLSFFWWRSSKELFSGRIETKAKIRMRVNVELFPEKSLFDNVASWGCFDSRSRLGKI